MRVAMRQSNITYYHMKIQNYDVQDDESNGFIQLHDFMPDRCFRMLLCGPSGSGKTNLLLELIYKLLYGISSRYI